MCLHALDSAFDRILRALNTLNAMLVLRPESVHAKSASIESIRAALEVELRESLGQSGLDDFEQFSRTVKEMDNHLIDQCMTLEYGQNLPKADA